MSLHVFSALPDDVSRRHVIVRAAFSWRNSALITTVAARLFRTSPSAVDANRSLLAAPSCRCRQLVDAGDDAARHIRILSIPDQTPALRPEAAPIASQPMISDTAYAHQKYREFTGRRAALPSPVAMVPRIRRHRFVHIDYAE
jgi:hypothetical protein